MLREPSPLVASALCVFGIVLAVAGLVMVAGAQRSATVAVLGGWCAALTGFLVLGAGLALLATAERTLA